MASDDDGFDHIARLHPHIYFGKYICDATAEELRRAGVSLIVDLTERDVEGLHPYAVPAGMTHVSTPIQDTGIGTDDIVQKLVQDTLLPAAREEKTVYVHCLGGHGRSATIAGILYGKLLGLDAEVTLRHVHEAHQRRRVMKPHWRSLGAPQTKPQFEQVRRLLA